VLEPLPGRKAIIALTDGLDNRSATTGEQVLEQIGPSGLSISVVGLGDPSQLRVSNSGLDEAGLQALAANAGGVYGYAVDPESVRQLYERYARALQSEYVITYTSPSPLRDGVKRRLSVSLAEASSVGVADYNPGGVVPEVPASVSWQVFAAALGGLVVLLFVPALIGRAVGLLRGTRSVSGRSASGGAGGSAQPPGAGIRLHEPPPSRIRLR
jgi:hypothetical protein